MGSMGHTDPHINGISRLAASMHPAAAAAFSTGWNSTPDYRERYNMMEMQQHAHASPYNHGRPSSSFNLNVNAHGSTTTTSGGGGYQHQPQALEWQQRHASDSDHIMARQLQHQHHQHQVHHVHAAAENNISMRGPGGSSSSRISAMLGGGPDSMNINNTGSPASLQSCSTSSELFGNDSSNSTTVVSASGGDWQQFVDNSGVRYSSLLPPSTSSCGSPIMQQHAAGVNEGAMIRELIGRLGGSSMGPSSSNNGGPGATLVPSSPPASTRPQQHGGGPGGVDNLMGGVLKLNNGGNHGWNAANENNVSCLTVDPSKGGLSLNGGRGHCLSPFSADPGFAERAARFSSFSNNGNYAQSFSSGGDQGTGTSATHASRMWSSSRSAAASPQQQQFSESSGSKHLSRTSSCPPLDVINSGSSTPDFLPGAAIRETHSGRGVSGHAAGAADEDENDDDNSPERTTYGRVLEGRPAAAKHGDEEDEELHERTTSTTSADHATTSDPQAGRGTRGISTSGLELSAPREACPSSGNSSGGTDISAKKRKTVLDERLGPNKDVGSASASSHGDRDTKATETEDAKAKRFRRGEGCREKDDIRSKAERPSCSETSGETSPRPMKDHSKHSEPPIKPDYIHVRARRGQATDSHSLAERVRREKISERMKFLQDLVPGCSKVTGKAVMLDEIINYVQSLQRQVEFLSMKLASVNPRFDFNLESFLGKESPHPGSQATESSILYPSVHPQQQHQTQLQQQPGLDYQLHSEATLRRSLSVPVPAALPRADGFRDDVTAQTMWGDGELQSIVQMGFGNTQSMSSQALHCHIPPGQVKVELQQSPISCL